MLNKLYEIMENLGVLIDQLEEMDNVLKLQGEGVRDGKEYATLRSVINIQMRLLEQVLADSEALYEKMDYTILDLKFSQKKGKQKK